MKKERFSELLTDLYTAYNPDHLMYVDSLVEKYSRMEFNAAEMVLVKYNHPNYAHYDPDKSTDEYIHQLIKDYGAGNRTLKGFTVDMQIQRNKEDAANKTKEQLELEQLAKEKSDKELSGIKGKLSDTEKRIEDAQKKLDERLKQINKQITNTEPVIQKTSFYDDVEISIISNYTASELILPNKELLAGLGKGSRIVAQDKAGKPIGLMVVDILYDCVSHPVGIPIIEITIDKG